MEKSERGKQLQGEKNIYTFGDMIAEGGQAKIYQAKSKDQGKSVYWAVKQFEKQRMELNVKRFQDMIKEIQCLKAVNTSTQLRQMRNIIHLEECIKTQNSYYLIFEFCNGGDLRDVLVNRFPIPQNNVQYMIRSIAMGLQTMHTSFNFIHRDIKPENVLLNCPSLKANCKKELVWDQQEFTETVEIKICDLGLSKTLEATGTATQVGTANFICPENFLGHGYDFKADVWAIGSLTFELIVGLPIMGFFDPSKK